jgi:hypothetical protein
MFGMRIGQNKSAVTACIGELFGDLERLNSKLDIGNFETASRPVSKSSVTIQFLVRFSFSNRRENIRSQGRHFMEEVHGGGTGVRRNEDIALDLMKFVAMTTGYGRTTSSGVGFQGTGAAAKPEEYAGHLLELYGKCLQAIAGKK